MRGCRTLKHPRELAGFRRRGRCRRKTRFGGGCGGSLELFCELARLRRFRRRGWRRGWGCRRQRSRFRTLPEARFTELLFGCRQMILFRQPLLQALIRRRHRHHKRVALVFADFNQLRHRVRRHRAQTHQERFILRIFPADQQVHRHIAAGVRLPRAIGLDAFPRQQFDQVIFLREVHVTSGLLSIMLPSMTGVQHRRLC